MILGAALDWAAWAAVALAALGLALILLPGNNEQPRSGNCMGRRGCSR